MGRGTVAWALGGRLSFGTSSYRATGRCDCRSVGSIPAGFVMSSHDGGERNSPGQGVGEVGLQWRVEVLVAARRSAH